jgi:hypothetical protein
MAPPPTYDETLRTFESLKEGDRIEITHLVKVGFRAWKVTTAGTVIRKERRRHGIHFSRSPDDRVFSDTIVLRRDDGETTAVTTDEFSILRVLERGPT